jgi:hypothetical protein
MVGGEIVFSYSTGSPSNDGGQYVGGLLGYDAGGGYEDDYWDRTTSGIEDKSQGAGNVPNVPSIKGLTSKRLRHGLPPGFDPAVWVENPNINDGFPYLIANPPPN